MCNQTANRRKAILLLGSVVLLASLALIDRPALAAPPVPLVTTADILSTTATLSFEIDFGETVVGFDAADVGVVNGTVSSLVDNGSGREFTLGVAAVADGGVTVQVPAGSVQNGAGEDNVVSNLAVVEVDTLAPSVTFDSLVALAPTGANPIPATLSFSEPVVGLASSDLVVVNGSVGSLSGGPTLFDVEIVPSLDGPVIIDLPAGRATDLAGNDNAASNPLSLVYSSSILTPVLTSASGGTTTTSPIVVEVDFGKDVTGFELSDVTVVNGVAGNLVSVDARRHTFEVVPAGGGSVVVDVQPGAVQDALGRLNGIAAPMTTFFNDGVLSIGDASVNEDDGTVVVDVTLAGVLGLPVSIDYATADGTAVAGEDFVAAAGRLDFSGIDGETLQISVDVLSDTVVEGEESFELVLAGFPICPLSSATPSAPSL